MTMHLVRGTIFSTTYQTSRVVPRVFLNIKMLGKYEYMICPGAQLRPDSLGTLYKQIYQLFYTTFLSIIPAQHWLFTSGVWTLLEQYLLYSSLGCSLH
jgi:hypothetical protein